MLEMTQMTETAMTSTPAMAGYPKLYRLRTIERIPDGKGLIRNTAELYHRKVSLRVQWLSRQVDPMLLRGCIVMPEWRQQPRSADGALHISRLSCVQQVMDVSLMPLVPDSWLADTQLLQRLNRHWRALSAPYRRWFNTLFWHHPGRLARFLTCPGSINHHHNFRHGTLVHTLECVEIAMRMAANDDKVDKNMIRFACLVHDVGKSDEYVPHGKSWRLSQRGRLLGHKFTAVQWLSETWQVAGVSQDMFARVVHVLTATRGCKWNDTREPQLREAAYLSHADRLSGELA